MKKILLSICAVMLITFSAHAEKRIGISAAFTMLDTSGTETTKSSKQKNREIKGYWKKALPIRSYPWFW